MLSQSFVSHVSRLILGSFLGAQLQSVTWAMTEVIDVSVLPHRPEQPLPVPASQLFAYQRLQAKKEKEAQEAWTALAALTSVSWTVQVIRTIAESTTALTEIVFTPFVALQELLKKSEAEIQQRLAHPLALKDLLEEKKLVDLGDGWQAEISWDGKVNLSKTKKSSSELHVQSLTDVILDNVKAKDVSVSAPSVSLRGQADIDKLSISFDEVNPLAEPKTSVFELHSGATFTTRDLTMNGVLLNKGQINLTDPAHLQVQSLVNAGTLVAQNQLTIEAQNLFRNSGTLRANTVSLKANVIDQQTLSGETAPHIHAQNIAATAGETLNLAAGSLEGKDIALTSLGTLTNHAKLKADHLHWVAQGDAVQAGRAQAQTIDVKTFGNFVHSGQTTASKEIRLSGNVTEQSGTLQAQKLTLSEHSTFQNFGTTTIGELNLGKDIRIQNQTPLTLEESQGQADPTVKMTVETVTGKGGTWGNSGFLGVRKGTLGTVRNRGIWISDTVTLSDLRQGGQMKANHLTVQGEGVNEGNLVVARLDGEGSLKQGGTLRGDGALQIDLDTFEQKKTGAQEPQTHAKELTFSGRHIYIGEDSQIKAESLTVQHSWGSTFENEGNIAANTTRLLRTAQNGGSIQTQKFEGAGDFENTGEVIIADEATLQWGTVQQRGDFQAQKVTGSIQEFNTSDTTHLETVQDLTIHRLNIRKGGTFSANGTMNSDHFNNEGRFIWTGRYDAGFSFTGAKDSVVVYPEDYHVLAYQFDNEGQVEAKRGIEITVSSNGQKFGRVQTDRGMTFKGKAATDAFQNVDFGRVKGTIKIDTPDQDVKLTKEIQLPNDFEIEAKTVRAQKNIKAKSLAIKADTVDLAKDFVSQQALTLQADQIKIAGTVGSSNGAVTLHGKREKAAQRIENRGKILGEKLTVVADTFYSRGHTQGGEGSLFEVRKNFDDYTSSTVVLDKADLVMPSETLKLYGTLQLKALKKWASYRSYGAMPISFHHLFIYSMGYLFIEDFDIDWIDFYNAGQFALKNGKARGFGTYQTTKDAVTILSGENFKLSALEFDEQGVTRAPDGIQLTCGGSTISHWGRYESGGDITFEVRSNVPDSVASQNLENVDWKHSATTAGHGVFVDAEETNLLLTSPLTFGGKMTVDARSLINTRKLFANGLTINVQQHLKNTGLIHSGGRLDVNAGTVKNSGSGQIGAKRDVEITTRGNITNRSPVFSEENLTDVGFARIFSENGSVTLTSRKGDIINDFATIHGQALHFDADDDIYDTGYLMAFDPDQTSTFSARRLQSSCEYTQKNVTVYKQVWEPYYREEKYEGVNFGTFLTFGAYRPTRTRQVLDHHYVDRSYTVVKSYAKSTPGKIFLAGNCQLDASNYDIKGGVLSVGGALTNSRGKDLSLRAESIGPFRGTVQARDVNFTLGNLYSEGAQFRAQEIRIYSQEFITIVSRATDHHVQFQTLFQLTDFAARYASLFDRHPDGSFHLRRPEEETAVWDEDELVTTRPLNAVKPVRVMISPEALLRVFSLVPTGEIGLFGSPEEIVMSLNENAQDQARKGRLGDPAVPMIVWYVQETDKEQELYPVLVFPKTKARITDDMYSAGPLSLTARGALQLNQARLLARGPLQLRSGTKVTQVGGSLESETSIVVEAPQIVHEICKEVFFDLQNQNGTTIASKTERVTDVPVMKAPIVSHRGNVHATAIQIEADTYAHANGALNIQPAVLTAETHKAFHKGRKSATSSVHQEQAIPSVIQAKVAHFHGDTTLIGTLAQIGNTYKYAGLTLAAAVTTNESSSTAVNNGFFRTTTVTTETRNQNALSTVLSGDVIRDMNAKGGPLVMRSSILNMLNCELKTDLIQETTFLQNWSKTTTKVSGWSLPWFDDPRPALAQSINALLDADATADRLIAGLRSITNSLRLIADGLDLGLSHGTAIPSLVLNFANKMASLSYGTTTTREEVRQEIPVLNEIKGQVLRIKNKKTHLEGSVQEGIVDIETEEFTASAPQKRTTRKMTSTSTTISLNPLQVFRSGPLGLLPGLSHSEATGNGTEVQPETLRILADTILLRVGNLAFSGAQLMAKTVDAIVDGTMTIESLQKEVMSKEQQTAWSTHLNVLGAGAGGALKKVGAMTGFQKFLHGVNNTPLGAIPTFRHEDRQHVERYVAEVAQFIGTEQFTLKVGEVLIKRSAEVGLRIDGVVTNSGIDAKKVLNQPLQDVRIDKKDVVAVPLADTLALFGAINELNALRRQAFDSMKAQGLSDQEALESMNDPGVREIMVETAKTAEKIQERRQKAQEKFEKSAAEILKTYQAKAPEQEETLESLSSARDCRWNTSS